MTDLSLARTPLYDLHLSLGAKLVPFAGFAMPLHYPPGIVAEHLHTRTRAALFDVSHMGQALLSGASAARDLEALVPGDVLGLAPGRMRYTLFTNERGGILDDLMVANSGDALFLVVNAARKAEDLAHLGRGLAGRAMVTACDDRALLALQGPAASEVLGRLAPPLRALSFMSGRVIALGDLDCFVTRSGYTGEDGFEISVPTAGADRLARLLLAAPEVMPAGLGARDTLRLEAGFCLYGHDIDETTTIVEADLAWTVPKRRRGEGGFPGAAIVQRQLAEGAPRKRVGILPEGKAPAREGTPIVAADGAEIGRITSGGFGPSLGGPIAMGYVAVAQSAIGTPVGLVIRGTVRPARIVPLPFVPHRYYHG
ncbi:MAG TPA: glycine cleavage system aminomethyltransferase GcvT [Stellaceae bacterium]|nr:glycine cleavage system aminomethyltransferase GcvT [Stellaceae bacterium]